MTTVSFTTVAQEFPEGTAAGFYNVAVNGTDGIAVQAQNVGLGGEATFTLPAGTYTASVTLLDVAGNVLGVKVESAAFTIAAPAPVTVSLQVPVNVTVA